MARTLAQVLSGRAPAIARPAVRRAAAKPAHTGKRHTSVKKKRGKPKAEGIQCWTRTNASGGIYKTCAKPKGTKPKARGKTKPLIARTNQLVPGITAPMYGTTMTVRQGAARQQGIPLRRAGGGGAQQPRVFVQLPPRARRVPARYRRT